MRRVDDLIVNTLNAVVPTDSFHTDSNKACSELKAQIEEGNVKREKAIKSCIVISAERVRKLREQRETDADDVQVSKNLRAEQTKVVFIYLQNIFGFCLIIAFFPVLVEDVASRAERGGTD